MEGIYFNLSGKTAFFKKPDVNIFYFTYNNIHKIALLGLLGAIAGYSGYNNQMENDIYPEFYNKLSKLKVSIVPKGDRGYFTKKMQLFNNSVGYASKEEGGNLVVSEQWLENPEWDIYLIDDDSIEKEDFNRIKDYLINEKCIYMPYLGKNDHTAYIKDVKIVELELVQDIDHIDSLFPYETAELEDYSYDDSSIYFYREYLPWELDEALNSYIFKEMAFTNRLLEEVKNGTSFYRNSDKILCFV